MDRTLSKLNPINPLGIISIPPWFSFLLTLFIFFSILGLLYIPFINLGNNSLDEWVLNEGNQVEKIELPHTIKTHETKWVSFSTTVGHLQGKSLILSNLDVNALTASFNGRVIYEIGDLNNPTANLWNSMILIPLPDSESTENQLSLEVAGNYFISMSKAPILIDREQGIALSLVHKFIYNDFLLLLMGGAFLTSLYLIGFALIGSSYHLEDLLLGVACFAIVIYSMEFTYRISTGPLGVYYPIKRFILSCAYLGSYLYMTSVDYYCYKRFTVSRWLLIPSVICFLLAFITPDLGTLFNLIPYMNLVQIVNFLLISIMVYQKKRDNPIVLIPTVLVLLSLVQITWNQLTQPSNPGVLQYAIVLGVIFFGLQFLRDRRDIIQERDNLKKAINRDPLTQAYNRRALNDLDLNGFCSAIFLDFDHFKYFNDRFGHDKGDWLLKEFVLRTSSILRKDDIVLRFGGDEFLILLKETNPEDVHQMADRIRSEFRQIHEDDKIDLSYGITSIEQNCNLDIKNLDEGMYSMKKNKRRP